VLRQLHPWVGSCLQQELRDDKLQVSLNDPLHGQLYHMICFSWHFNSIFKDLEDQEITTHTCPAVLLKSRDHC